MARTRVFPTLLVTFLMLSSLPLSLATAGLTPGAPTGLVAAGGPGDHEITLTWNAPEGLPGATAYVIYRGTIEGSETFLTNVGNVLTFTDSGLPRATTYYYRVSG